jgi:hypothetical protein
VAEDIMIKAGRKIPGKKAAGGCGRIPRNGLLSDNTFEPVTDKSTQDKDDEKEEYPDKQARRSQKPEVDAHTPGKKVLCSENEDDPQDKADNDTIFEETIIIFLSLVEKAKGDTQYQVQNFKQHENALC